MKVAAIEYVHAVHDVIHSNIDILIRLEDKRVFSATVFTLENIATIMERHRQSGESMGGLYFWTSDMIIARTLDRESVDKAVRHIIEVEGYLTPFEEVSV